MWSALYMKRAHCHRDALKKEGLALFEKVFDAVNKREKRCAQRN